MFRGRGCALRWFQAEFKVQYLIESRDLSIGMITVHLVSQLYDTAKISITMLWYNKLFCSAANDQTE